MPPATIERPIRKSTLRIIEPVIDALTIVSSPARRAKIAIMNSMALPKVALMSAEIVLDTRCEIMPVASTMRWEMATTAAAAEVKDTIAGSLRR